LPTAEGTKLRQRFQSYPLGYVHVDLAEVWTQAGKLYLFVAIDRVSKFAFAELHERATRRIAAEFLRRLIDRVPYRIHTVLTDNGFQFTPPRGGWSVGEIQQLLANHRPFVPMPSTWRVRSTRSSIGSHNSTIHGPMARSSG
jgi:hypothetical protein